MSPNRRDFLTSLGGGSLGGLLWKDLSRDASGEAAAQYLFSPGLIYFGTATMGPCPRQVIEETVRAWYELETNPTGMGYGHGTTIAAAEGVRERAANLLGSSTDEIIITRSTTDGMNAIAQGLRLTRGQRVLTTDQEHPGGRSCWEYLAHQQGVEIDRIRIPAGENDARAIVDRFAAAITGDTRVISVSHILSSTGLRMPIADISALAKAHGIVCVVDGAQAVGGVQVNVKSLGCHAYATSGHKWMMGPKGTGLLYLSRDPGTLVEPIQLQGGRTYYSQSSGVGNLPGVVGLGMAIDSMKAQGMPSIESHNVALRNRFYDGLQRVPKVRVVSAEPGPLATPLITFTLPPDIDSQSLTDTLRDKHRVIVKMVPKEWLNGIRLSPHIFNTEKEVDAVVGILRSELA